MASNLPKTFKAYFFEKVGQPMVLRDVELKMPEEGELLLKIHACGVCRSDEMVKEGQMVQLPLTPGHEFVGSVVAIGKGVKDWKEGDRAGGPWHGGHDGTCKACRRGLFQCCEKEEINGITRNGGYAEYCTIRSEAAVRLPADIEPVDYAPLLCAGVTVFNGIRKMGITAGDTVAIQGLGGLGHLAVQFSRKMGYRTVALSSSDAKRQFAKDLGANEYVDGSKEDTGEALQKMGGASLIVMTAPNPKLVQSLQNGLGVNGKLLILSPVGDVPVNTLPMIMKGLSVHGWPSGHALDSEEAILFAQNQGVKAMVEKFPFDKANEAFDHMLSGKARFKCVLSVS